MPCNNQTLDEYNNGESLNPANASVLTTKTSMANNVDDGGGSTTTNTTTTTNKATPTKKQRAKKRSTDKRPIQNENDLDDGGELFEFEECETPLLPLYLLRDEGPTKWVLFSDLCYVLKLKSKEALLKQVGFIFASLTRTAS